MSHSVAGTYALDGHRAAVADHLQTLADLLDSGTRQRIAGLAGWSQARRCLEIGAGGGTIAGWLADQVGPDGEVVACDLTLDHIRAHPRLSTVAHDLTSEIPLARVLGTGYDLIYARLTIQHLPNRRAVLAELAKLLTPGNGTLLIEEWAGLRVRDNAVASAPSPAAKQLYRRYQRAIGVALDAAGAGRSWPREVYAAMCEEGLVDVHTAFRGEYWRGGEPGLRLSLTTAKLLRVRLLEAGMTEADLEQLAELVHDERLVVHGLPLYSTSGRRP